MNCNNEKNDITQNTFVIQNNDSSRKQYMKEYRKKNIDKWNEKKTCNECGYEYSSCNSTNHFRSKKHQIGIIIKENEKYKNIKI